MPFEVEYKFAVANLAELRRQIESLGGRWSADESHVDSYYAHPQRDFRQTDEALRVRDSNGSCQITYKGPRADSGIKIREEIEIPIVAGSENGARASELLTRLGFRFIAAVQKHRSLLRLRRDNRSILFCLDQVEGLGSFVEIEIMSNSDQLIHAQHILQQLQQELGLNSPIATSYLRMLLSKG